MAAVVEEKALPEFEQYVKQFNQDYVLKIKKLGLQNEYTLDVNGKPVTFTRKRLTTRVYNQLEEARGKTDKEIRESNDGMENARKQAELYLKIAQAYLFNKETSEPIKKEEFLDIVWEDMKIILDACHLRTMIGSPN